LRLRTGNETQFVAFFRSLLPIFSEKAIAFSWSLAHNSAMLAKVCSAAVNGVDAYPVEVEVNAGYGDTLLVIVGLPDAAVKESRDRVIEPSGD